MRQNIFWEIFKLCINHVDDFAFWIFINIYVIDIKEVTYEHI
jgi:hypothetical protein